MERYYILSTKYALYERKKKDGKKVYDMVFRVITMDGKEKQKWIRGFSSKKKADEAHLAFITEHCEVVKENPAKKKDAAKNVLLVGDLVRQYLSTLGNQNKQSVIYDKNNIYRLYLLPLFEKTPITKLTKEELYRWQDWLWSRENPKTKKFYSQKYLKKLRSQFNVFLDWVEKRYGIKNNLPEVIKPKKREQQSTMGFWTKTQFEQFISVVDNPTYHALFTFMFYTGRRKGELFALYKTDIKDGKITYNKSVNRRHFGQNTWEITTTKANKTCTLPYCAAIREELKIYTPPQEGKFFFGGEEPLAPTTVERKFKYYTAMANLPCIRLHDLRHSFASLLIHNGANIYVVAEFLSDTPEMVTRTYGHLWSEDLQTVIERI
jgi:integrase